MSILTSCFIVLIGCKGTFEQQAYLSSENNDVETCIYWVVLRKNTVAIIRNSKTWISLNHIVTNLMELEGNSTEDLDIKSYLMS